MVAVQLLVYDLSRGMAAQMSEAFLGQRIEGVWHTGVSVFGFEYFFGGGVQRLPLGAFASSQGLQPVSVLDMGDTRASPADAEAFLQRERHRFSAAAYDLLSNNCNNFSDALLRFLCGRGVPAHILDLPRAALASPNGALLRALLEGAQTGTGAGGDPFARAAGGGGSFPRAPPPAPPRASAALVLEERAIVSADRDASVLRAMVRKVSAGAEAVLSREELRAVGEAVEAGAGGDGGAAMRALARLVGDPASSRCQLPALFIARVLALSPSQVDPALCGLLARMLLEDAPFASAACAVVGVAVLLNASSHAAGLAALRSHDGLCDAAMRALSHPSAEVARLGGCLVYNLCLAAAPSDAQRTHGLSDEAAQVVCGAVQLLDESASRPRLLRVLALLARQWGPPALSLMQDLGLEAALLGLRASAELADQDHAALEELLRALAV